MSTASAARAESSRAASDALVPPVSPRPIPKRALRPWGTLSDGHSRVSWQYRKILAELATEHDMTKPLVARKVREAASLMALAHKAKAELGVIPKVTLRNVTGLSLAAERVLASVRRNGGARAEPSTPSIAEVIAARRNDA